MTNRKKYLIESLAIAASVVAVLMLAKEMLPVKEGRTADFWKFACGVDIGGADLQTYGGFYQPRDGWYIYYSQGIFQQFLFRVPRAQAVAAFPEVVRRIRLSANATNALSSVGMAAAVLDRNPAVAGPSPEQFLSLLRDERLNSLLNQHSSLYDYAVTDEQEFSKRWTRIRHYWMNVVCESVYFGGLTLFALWPWLRGKGSWCWGLHLGSLPVLLMLPYYCGYAAWTFSDPGPSGGVLYPWIIFWLRDSPTWTGADHWVFEHIPKILVPLSQSPGPAFDGTGCGALGPVTALAIGVGMAICISAGVGFAKHRTNSASSR
jgi:hypothetical protein